MGTVPDHGLGHKRGVVPTDLITCTQVHGATVLDYAGQPAVLSGTEGDAIISQSPGACLGVRTADCLPILLYTDDGRTVAAVHAGWRGTVAGISVATITAFADRYDIAPDQLCVTFGPCIRPCCYQVGDELIDAVHENYPRWSGMLLESRPDGAYFDLAALNRLQLESIGITRITDAGACTCCNADDYHSYRRDAEASGRMVSWIRSAT
jgi:YfiH family protein